MNVARRPAPMSWRRRALGLVVAAAGLTATTVTFTNLRDTLRLNSLLLCYLLLAIVVTIIGGALAGGTTVVAGFVLAKWFFVPWQYRLSIVNVDDLVALLAYVVAAGIVVLVVDRSLRAPPQS